MYRRIVLPVLAALLLLGTVLSVSGCTGKPAEAMAWEEKWDGMTAGSLKVIGLGLYTDVTRDYVSGPVNGAMQGGEEWNGLYLSVIDEAVSSLKAGELGFTEYVGFEKEALSDSDLKAAFLFDSDGNSDGEVLYFRILRKSGYIFFEENNKVFRSAEPVDYEEFLGYSERLFK